MILRNCWKFSLLIILGFVKKILYFRNMYWNVCGWNMMFRYALKSEEGVKGRGWSLDWPCVGNWKKMITCGTLSYSLMYIWQLPDKDLTKIPWDTSPCPIPSLCTAWDFHLFPFSHHCPTLQTRPLNIFSFWCNAAHLGSLHLSSSYSPLQGSVSNRNVKN